MNDEYYEYEAPSIRKVTAYDLLRIQAPDDQPTVDNDTTMASAKKQVFFMFYHMVCVDSQKCGKV